MKKYQLMTLLLFFPLVCWSAITLQHYKGTLKLEKPPTKIVALEFSFVDALVTLGVAPMGIADDGDPKRIIEPIREKMPNWKSVGMRKQPSLELMASLSPNLIIADMKRHQSIYDQLSKLAPTILLDSLGESYSSDRDSLEVIAKALGKEKELKEIIKNHDMKLKEYSDKLKSVKAKKILFAVSWEEGVHIHTPIGYVPGLFKVLGLNYATFPKSFGHTKASEKVTLEHLLSIDPEILILARSKPHVLFDEWVKSPLWKHLKVAKNKQVYFVDQTLWTRARGVIAAESMVENLMQTLKL